MLVSAVTIAAWSCAGAIPSDNRPSQASVPASGRLDASDLLSVRLITSHPTQSLPIIRLGTSDELTLQFEMETDVGRPWSIRFLPATIDWEPSYEPEPETLPAPDELFDYDTSNTNDFPYVHYEYTFPNQRVSFSRSGNYLMEVFDGRSGQTLFDRGFYITDDDIRVALDSNSWALITDQPDELLPEARIDVPNDPWVPAGEVEVRFLKNGWTNPVLASGQPKIEGATYIYTPAEPFPFTRTVFGVDLSDPTQIHQRDDITIPATLDLFPDDYRFFREQYQLSSPVPRLSFSPYDPNQEYVQARFYLAKAPSGDAPHLTGSFNNWLIEPKYRMKWDAREGGYMLDLLLKNEEHFYAYYWDGEGLGPVSKFEGPNEVHFTALVYAKDTRYPTHRLWAVTSESISD